MIAIVMTVIIVFTNIEIFNNNGKKHIQNQNEIASTCPPVNVFSIRIDANAQITKVSFNNAAAAK